MQLAVRPSVEAALGKLPEEEQIAALDSLRAIPAAFGRPHVHAGLGLRQLRPGVYEARLGLALRAVFTRDGDVLQIQMIGNHDEVKRYLRGR